MPSDNSHGVRKRKQRVGAACDFCRQRKLGCDNAKPKCENCHSHQRSCTYTVRIKKERPSNGRINHLEEENARLRKLVDQLHAPRDAEEKRAQEEDWQIGASEISTSARSCGAPLLNQQSVTNAKILPAPARSQNVSATAEINMPKESQATRFHGPSSAMFDGELPSKKRGIGASSAVDASHKIQLLAETAKQRQLELINFRSGRLKFEGVEPQLGMDLLLVFWNRQHATGSIVYRTCFMRDMATQGPYFSPILLNSILFVASKHVPRLGESCSTTDSCTTGAIYRRRIEDILYSPNTQILCKSSITTIQALLLFSDALFSWCDERSLSWHYLGIAANMIIDLGIHSENALPTSGTPRSPEDVEIHRRVFWGAFVLDKIQSIYQGRPTRLRDMDSSVPILFLDEYEELEPFDSVGYSASPSGLGKPTYSVSTFEHLCKLSTIADRILHHLYAEKSWSMAPAELFRASKSLYADLAQWRESLPAHLSIQFEASGNPNTSSGAVPLPHTLCLLLMYHALIILLHRPFVQDGHLKSIAEPETRDAFSVCEAAASEIDVMLRWYKKQFCIKSPPYFLSYATYVSATIHVRVAAQNYRRSEAHRRLRNCLEILSEHQNVCRAPRRALNILLGLAKRLRVDTAGDFTASVSHTAQCDTLRSINENSSPYVDTRSYSMEKLSVDMLPRQTLSSHMPTPIGSLDLEVQPLGRRNGPGEVSSPHIDHDMSEKTGSNPQSMSYGFEELLTDVNFDFDPLFGFDMDLGTDFGF